MTNSCAFRAKVNSSIDSLCLLTQNAAFEFCQAEYFLAYKDGKLVGRCAAIINPHANEAWKCRKVRFGWIDFIDDTEVSAALLKSVEKWGKERGRDEDGAFRRKRHRGHYRGR